MLLLTYFLAFIRRLHTWIIVKLNYKKIINGFDLHIGRNSKFWAPNLIEIGNSVYIGKNVTIECDIKIGNFVLIANNVSIIGRHDHDFRCIGVPVRFAPWIGGCSSKLKFKQTIIEDDCWIGFGAVIMSEIIINRGAIIAAGSVVTRDVPSYSIVAGNPAIVIGSRFSSKFDIEIHEKTIGSTNFFFSERGYRYWSKQTKDNLIAKNNNLI